MSDENDARTAELWPEEVDGSTNPLDAYAEEAYLSAAAAWLVTAERAHSVETDSRAYPATRTDARATVAATTRLAEVTIAMAGACGAYQARQPVTRMAEGTVEAGIDDTLRAAVQADIAEQQAQTIRPGVDPEPPEEGVLLAADGGWFYYAVDTIPPPNPGYIEKARWLAVRHYAEFLRWRDERGIKPMAATWSEVAGDVADAQATLHPTLRRPTDVERTAFYGPEPDPMAEVGKPEDWVGGAIPEVCGKCGGRHVGDCAVPAVPGCCTACNGTGTVPTGYPCEDCYATGHCHPDDAKGCGPIVAVDDQSEDVAQALERCAKAAEVAGKTRTASWLYECAKRAQLGVQAWPDAPAYKGAVVHIDNPRPDLESLTAGQLRGLLNTLVQELDRRGA